MERMRAPVHHLVEFLPADAEHLREPVASVLVYRWSHLELGILYPVVDSEEREDMLYVLKIGCGL